jgi:hypothetical protein
VNFSRTPRDHLQRLGDILAQLAQALAAAAQAGGRCRLDDPLARQMLRERFARRPLARERRHGRRLGGGPLGGELVLGGRRFQLLQLQFQLIDEARGALRALAEALAVELLDLELQMRDQCLVGRQLRPGGGGLRLCHDQRRFERIDIVGKGIRRQHGDAD